jgi:CysZ protein
MQSLFSSFLSGFRAPFRGILFLGRHRTLWKYVWIPFLINVLLFAGLGVLFVIFYPKLIQTFMPYGDAWYWVFLRGLLWLVGSVLLLLFFLFAFVVVGNLIAGPFNDLLSEQVERTLLGDLTGDSPGFRDQLVQTGRTVMEEMKRLLFYISGCLVLLLLNLLPALGTLIYAGASGVWTLLFLALEFGDFYLCRHWIGFRQRWGKIWTHRWSSLGFGGGAAVLLFVPLLNLLLIPGAVTGATLLWVRLEPPAARPQSTDHLGRE